MLGRSGCEGGGTIVNVASLTMHGGWPDLAAYVSTKGTAAAFTRAPARELGPREIRVNCVSPGAFPTAAEEIHEDLEAYNRMVLERQALRHAGRAEPSMHHVSGDAAARRDGSMIWLGAQASRTYHTTFRVEAA